MDRSILLKVALLAGVLAVARLDAAEPNYRFASVRTIDGPCCGDWGSSISVDTEGAVFVAGRRGGLDLNGNGVVDLDTYGSPDSMVFKAFGTSEWLDWVKGPGGVGEDFASGVAPDGQGGAYVVGQFDGRMQVGKETVTGSGRKGGFLARFDRRGEVVWVRAIGGAGDDRIAQVAVDSEGSVFVVGTVAGSVDVDRDGTVDVDARGASAMLLASFDPTGALRFARATEGTARTMGWFVSVGREGELHAGGHYMAGTLDLDGDGQDDIEFKSIAGRVWEHDLDANGLLMRLSPAGELRWMRRYAAAVASVTSNGSRIVVTGTYTDGNLRHTFTIFGDDSDVPYAARPLRMVTGFMPPATPNWGRTSAVTARSRASRYATSSGTYSWLFTTSRNDGGAHSGLTAIDAGPSPVRST
ncbi:hypothetical protein Q6D67_03710 [Haliea sp. E1-2-M8]|uniref:hypothetical protein n=1 Tax=Haliea sp. E1-2-M8 TaxID=3064706 RepID=UPI00271F79FE|nr:hypothetical protein [Haliea sp. E1-2-M8]MDO8860799.1 hypothetical protein [Haliea sp. E1-2-M8]